MTRRGIGVALCAVLLLTACSGNPNRRPPTATTHATSTSTSVASTNTSIATSTTTTSLVLAQACSADQLGIASISSNGATGHTGTFVSLQNLSATTCSLSGAPTSLSARPTDGGSFTFQRGTFFPDPEDGNIDARSCCGVVIIESSFACGDGTAATDRTYKNIRIGMPGGGTLSLGDFAVTSNCEVRISKLGIERTE
ncbi:MAG: hypothetical protein QOI61_730 [Actinomycetota bacterium]|jgi:hypothetical protein